MKKFIVLQNVINKSQLALNKNNYKLESMSLSTITISPIQRAENLNNPDYLTINTIRSYDISKTQIFKCLKGIVLSKTIATPDNKLMIKYEITNESFDSVIFMVL